MLFLNNSCWYTGTSWSNNVVNMMLQYNDTYISWEQFYKCNFHQINTLRPRQNGHHFADNIFKCIFLNENVWIPIKISLKFIPKGPINNIPALVQIVAWHCPGNKRLSEPMMVNLAMHIEGILPKGPYPPCLRMADRALLAGYSRYMHHWASMS